MKKVIFLMFSILASISLSAADPEPVVSIYDEFDDGLFGKSRHRGVIVSVKKAAFARSESLDVEQEGEPGYITAVVMGRETGDNLLAGYYDLPYETHLGHRVYTYSRDGLEIAFSIEKAKETMIRMVSDFYSKDQVWHDPLVEYYSVNYVIRIHKAENVFESWNDEITYNEAMVAATLLGDRDQWLWGIHNGSDILNQGY